MKFGFDVDGTLTALPAQLGAIMRALRAAGHEVHVITGQTAPITDASFAKRRAQLSALGLDGAYDELHIAGPPDWVADKHAYCAEWHIDLMVEDSLVYAAAISAVTPLLMVYPGNRAPGEGSV